MIASDSAVRVTTKGKYQAQPNTNEISASVPPLDKKKIKNMKKSKAERIIDKQDIHIENGINLGGDAEAVEMSFSNKEIGNCKRLWLSEKFEVMCLLPGVVLLKSFLKKETQQFIVNKCTHLGVGSGGFYRPKYASGAKCKLHMMCLGRHWDLIQEKYEDTRTNFDGADVLPLPEEFHRLVQWSIEDAKKHDQSILGTCEKMSPDICVVNYYNHAGRNGLHTDKDESEKSISSGSPVVSFSIGCAADFAYCKEPPTAEKNEVPVVRLESGDVMIFGGPNRLLVHALTHVFRGTAPSWLKMRPGRLNLTFRDNMEKTETKQ